MSEAENVEPVRVAKEMSKTKSPAAKSPAAAPLPDEPVKPNLTVNTKTSDRRKKRSNSSSSSGSSSSSSSSSGSSEQPVGSSDNDSEELPPTPPPTRKPHKTSAQRNGNSSEKRKPKAKGAHGNSSDESSEGENPRGADMGNSPAERLKKKPSRVAPKPKTGKPKRTDDARSGSDTHSSSTSGLARKRKAKDNRVSLAKYSEKPVYTIVSTRRLSVIRVMEILHVLAVLFIFVQLWGLMKKGNSKDAEEMEARLLYRLSCLLSALGFTVVGLRLTNCREAYTQHPTEEAFIKAQSVHFTVFLFFLSLLVSVLGLLLREQYPMSTVCTIAVMGVAPLYSFTKHVI